MSEFGVFARCSVFLEYEHGDNEELVEDDDGVVPVFCTVLDASHKDQQFKMHTVEHEEHKNRQFVKISLSCTQAFGLRICRLLHCSQLCFCQRRSAQLINSMMFLATQLRFPAVSRAQKFGAKTLTLPTDPQSQPKICSLHTQVCHKSPQETTRRSAQLINSMMFLATQLRFPAVSRAQKFGAKTLTLPTDPQSQPKICSLHTQVCHKSPQETTRRSAQLINSMMFLATQLRFPAVSRARKFGAKTLTLPTEPQSQPKFAPCTHRSATSHRERPQEGVLS